MAAPQQQSILLVMIVALNLACSVELSPKLSEDKNFLNVETSNV